MVDHGHEAPAHGAEHGKSEHAAKHETWERKAIKNVMKAGLLGLGVVAFGPAILQAANVILPQYMKWIGVGAAAWYLKGKLGDKKKDAHGGGHAPAHAH